MTKQLLIIHILSVILLTTTNLVGQCPSTYTDTDGDNIANLCDDENDNDGILNGSITNGEVEDYRHEVILPLELSSFSGMSQGCTNILDWTTAVEVNTRYFEILHSPDGNEFKMLDAVKVAGTSTQINHYSFSHAVTSPRSYYKLRTVDINGDVSLSEIITVNANCKVLLAEISLYPNPTNNDIKLSFTAEKERTMELSVIDGLGRIVLEKQTEISTGFNTVELLTDDLSPGIYHVKIHGDYLYNLQFVKTE